MRSLRDELEDALGELRSKHRSIAAPPGLERKLRTEMRTRRPARPMLYWPPALAAAALIAFLVLRVPPSTVTVPAPVPRTAALAPEKTESQFQPVEPVAKTKTAAVRPVPAPPLDPIFAFMPLPSSEFLSPPQTTTILTMQLRKGDLRQYGLDVPAPLTSELVRVDFVVGDDGLARAMRLVR